jgi:glycosyltransferase involved in cell wall biosynthesis
MKIGHVIHSLCCGGAETMVFGLARECALAGHTVEVIRLDKATGSLYEAKAVESLQEVGIATYSLDRRPGSSVFGLTAVAKLWLLAQMKRFDVIHSHVGPSDAFTGLARQFSPAPFDHVLTVHSTKEIRSKVANLLCGRPTVVYCSRASERAVKLRHHRSVIIPNGIPLAKYRYSPSSRIALRAALGLPESAFVVISVGNLREGKNYDCAISGIAADRNIVAEADIHYLICGDGPEGQRLKTKVRELGLVDRIHFLGVRIDVADLLSAADLFLSTSLFEGMPLSVLEALAASLPCLLSPLEEHREITEGVPCVELLTANSPKAVARGLRTATRNRPKRNELVAIRGSALEPFEIAHCASAYLALYEELRMARSGLSKCLTAANSSGQLR